MFTYFMAYLLKFHIKLTPIMIKNTIYSRTLHCFFIFISVIMYCPAQDLNIDESIDYLNKMFKKNESRSYKVGSSQQDYDSYLFKMDKTKGLMTVVEKYYRSEVNGGGIIARRNTFNIFEVDFGIGYHSIRISCKEGHCIKQYHVQGFEQYGHENSETTSSCDIDDIGKDVKTMNAIRCLEHIQKLCYRDPQIARNLQTRKRDPFSDDYESKEDFSANVINMHKTSGGLYTIPVRINNTLDINMLFDSGASDLVLSADVFSTLLKTNSIDDSEIIGKQKYQIADGSSVENLVIVIDRLQIGDFIVNDVRCSVSQNVNAPLLLGQSALTKLGNIVFDYANSRLIVVPE